MVLKPQMQLIESIQKTKKFFQKTLQSLESLLFGGYQKLPKPHSFNPFSCGSKEHLTDRYYMEFCNEWECALEKAMKRKNNSVMPSKQPTEEEAEKDACTISTMKAAKSPLKKKEEGGKEEKNKRSYPFRRAEEKSSKNMNEGDCALAKKMKELEMIDASDVEHVLDVEEALHYYSRLNSPVYLDIVDKFFMDMYTEFTVLADLCSEHQQFKEKTWVN